jgi:hypothetical protein
MALTIIDSPTEYNQSRNRNYVQISTDNFTFVVNQGNKALCYFNGLHNAVLNNTLTITFGVTTRTYTFKAATNIGAMEVAYFASGPIEQYMVQLANDLRSDTALSTYIEIIPSGTAVFFKALNGGTAYNMGTSSTTAPSVGFYNQNGTDDIVNQNRPNYKIELQLYGEKTPGVFELIAAEGKEPSSNKIRCDLSYYIDSYLSYDLPNFGAHASFKCSNVCKKFYVTILEKYGTPPVAQVVSIGPGGFMQNSSDTNIYFSLKAGFDTISNRIIPKNQFTYYNTHNAFLTRQNRTKRISRTQIEYLYFLFHTNPLVGAHLRCRYYHADGSISQATIYSTTGTVAAGQVWAFPAHTPTGIFSTDETVLKFECWVRDSGNLNALSEVFTFYPDDKVYLEETILYFANSDGGLDTLRCTGVTEASADFEREITERTLTVDDTKYDGDSEQTWNEKTNKGQIFSGWKTREELVYIEELLLSRKIFAYGNEFGQQIEIPLIILNKTHMKHRTKQNMYGYVIEYEEAIKSEISQANYYPVV